jgi:hypothetical protein
MAYGRLDVYWPDNDEFDSFLLTQETVSVGRSSGCTIMLDTDTISRYHFSIRQTDGEVWISDMDSVNGTFVDGVRVPDNDERPLHGGEEIQIGQLRMIYYAEDDQPTMALDQQDVDTQRFEREDYGFRVDITPPDSGIPPGSHKSVEIQVTNVSTEAQVYTVTVSGLPAGWGRVNRPSLRLDPDETGEVLLNIKPPRRSDTAPGEYPVTLIVARQEAPDQLIEAYALVEISPYNAFALGLKPKHVTLYERFNLILHNQGSAPLPVFVSGASADDALRFEIPCAQRVLGPGERVEVKGSVQARKRRLFGPPQDRPFDLLVRSRDAAGFLTAMRGHFQDEAIMPRWSLYAIGGLAAGIAGLLLFALALVFSADAPEPRIESFDAGGVTDIAGGDLLTLNWRAADAESFVVRVNDDPILIDLPADTTSVVLDTSAYASQNIVIELVAFRGEASDTQSLTVNVIEALTLQNFDVIPAELVRNVISTIQVQWEVNGASDTFLVGVESIRRAANVPVEVDPSYGPRGNLELEGYVTDDFVLELVARGRLGNEIAWQESITVIDPICTPSVVPFRLYSEPRRDSNIVQTYDALPGPLVVDRVDQTGGWVRTRIEGRRFVWGALDEMTCDETFNPADLLIEIVLPPATPTPAPTVTPPPSATAEDN